MRHGMVTMGLSLLHEYKQVIYDAIRAYSFQPNLQAMRQTSTKPVHGITTHESMKLACPVIPISRSGYTVYDWTHTSPLFRIFGLHCTFSVEQESSGRCRSLEHEALRPWLPSPLDGYCPHRVAGLVCPRHYLGSLHF